jgi:hypothetical protein
MTGSLILDVILSVGIVLVIVGMLGWAVVADHRARVGAESPAAASPPVTAPAASLSARRGRVSGSATVAASAEARSRRPAGAGLPLE